MWCIPDQGGFASVTRCECGSTILPMEVQIFGIKKSSDTRKALRFFAERRVKTHFVDLQERAASPGELRRFVKKFGPEALIARGPRRFVVLGRAPPRLSEER